MEKIAIIGLGVIGGSFAKALKVNDYTNYYVMGIDQNEETLIKAKEAGVITEGETENHSILQQADVVIFALYPDAIKPFIEKNRENFKNGAVLTDTTGVKADIINQLLPVIPAKVDFVFGHPMAGRESQGFDFSDPTAFIGANYIITPIETNRPESIQKIISLVSSLGFKQITQVSPERHDRAIAHTSQLCHVIATTLINSDDDVENTSKFVGDSYKELTRIANINEKLWSELMLSNRDALLENMHNFEEKWELFKNALLNDDKDTLETFMHEATLRRLTLEKKLTKGEQTMK